eukprot:CAMPEP_0116115568 /NCGR_PEP_ID=MMETSP0329-20121206/574_1 /TAXON_ID=697910 /ORGANISM="Pseudo-nitzschia arenysensis, Strain B593" /LENGTH=498 /DNA_ID=CAMNT_0003609005 /DNA_START=79 /DNA_END=1575 /DNA_ORIENTATION=-
MQKDMGNNEDDWWRRGDFGECPITLECFSTLEYPPFALYHPGKTPTTTTANGRVSSNQGVSAYFDGLALASYIVSRGVFQNPLTRVELISASPLYNNSGNNATAAAATIFRGSRVISVAEAFALRNSVSVGNATVDGNQDSNGERDRERIRALQNTATVALAGLFIYGNDRRRISAGNEITQSVPRIRSETDDTLLNDWGFDLSRQVEDSSTHQDNTHGYSVIDDDEQVEVAARRQAYENLQEAFPPLFDKKELPESTPRSETKKVSPDKELMERIRAMSTRDEKDKSRHSINLAIAREQLLRQALERRKQRQRDCAERLARGAKTYASQKKDQEELERARKEIEAWRDDQWEKLRLLSEHEQRKEKKLESSFSDSHPGDQSSNSDKDADDGNKGKAEEVDTEKITNDVSAEERKKAKAAAKRKRAKERKKAKKALEKEKAESIRLKEAETAKRAASSLKCAACGTGHLRGLTNSFVLPSVQEQPSSQALFVNYASNK